MSKSIVNESHAAENCSNCTTMMWSIGRAILMFPLLVYFCWLFGDFIVIPGDAQEIYLNSSTACTKCRCEFMILKETPKKLRSNALINETSTIVSTSNNVTKQSQEQQTALTIQCDSRDLPYIFANWPKPQQNQNVTIIRATFDNNEMGVLEILPPTDAKLYISFVNCSIPMIHPDVFDAVIHIQSIDLSYNQLRGELSENIFRGPQLPSLNDTKASNNTFRSLDLLELNLAHNQIHTLPMNMFKYTPNLTSLNLAGNPIHELDANTIAAIFRLPNLKLLNLGYVGLNQFNLMAKLPEINMNVGINELILDGNPIVEINSKTFDGLKNLTTLSLNTMTELRVVPADTFKPLQALGSLSICNNTQLERIDSRCFDSAPAVALQRLYLNDNPKLQQLSYVMLKNGSGWAALMQLQLRRNNVLKCTCDLYSIVQTVSDTVRNRSLDQDTKCIRASNSGSNITEYIQLTQLTYSTICEQETTTKTTSTKKDGTATEPTRTTIITSTETEQKSEYMPGFQRYDNSSSHLFLIGGCVFALLMLFVCYVFGFDTVLYSLLKPCRYLHRRNLITRSTMNQLNPSNRLSHQVLYNSLENSGHF